MTRPTILLSCSSVAALVMQAAALQATAGADEPTPTDSRLFTASEFPRLARGIELPRPGEYTVKVWAPARQAAGPWPPTARR